VLQVDDLASKNVYQDGKNIRNNEIYSKDGINVNFVEDFGDHYFVRTFERGVENETFACGTGVTAVSMAMAKKKGLTGKIKNSIKVPGGNLSVSFNYNEKIFSNVFLEGPATFVFEGSIEI
jgi:diaminopimelate epimerase